VTTQPPPPDPVGRIGGLVTVVKGLTFTNVLVIAMLVLILVPVYLIYQAVHDDRLLDRILSTYEEFGGGHNIPCAMRHVQKRGGPDQWAIASGFAFQGEARWFTMVVLDREPQVEELASYCETLKLIADSIRGGNGDADPADVE
jgi:hypothetical protein